MYESNNVVHSRKDDDNDVEERVQSQPLFYLSCDEKRETEKTGRMKVNLARRNTTRYEFAYVLWLCVFA